MVCPVCDLTTLHPPSPEQLARILGTKFYAARHPVEFEAAISELATIIRERDGARKELGDSINRQSALAESNANVIWKYNLLRDRT